MYFNTSRYFSYFLPYSVKITQNCLISAAHDLQPLNAAILILLIEIICHRILRYFSIQQSAVWYPTLEVVSMYRRIRDLREDRDLKQRQVAQYLNCSQQVYSNYELGQRDVPTEILIRLSDLYGVSVDYLLGLTSNPKRNK